MRTRALALVAGLVMIAVSCAETPGDTPVSPPTTDDTTTTVEPTDDTTVPDDTTTTVAEPVTDDTTTTVAAPATTVPEPTTTTVAPTPTTTDNVGPASGGHPTAETTGVPAGTTLTPRSGTITLSQAGQVLEGVDLNGCVKVTASNVIIRKSRITCGGSNAAVNQTGSATGLLIEDTEITGPSSGYAQAGVYSGKAYTVRRTEIRGHDDGAFLGSGTVIEDSWIHSLAASPGAHNDTLQMVGGSNVTIRNNRLEHRRGQTSAIIIKSDLAPISGVDIEGNYLAGGSFTVYVYAGKSSYGGCCDAPTNTRVVNNVIESGSFLFGAMAIQGDAEVTCNTTSDGQPITYFDSDRKTNPKVSACP